MSFNNNLASKSLDAVSRGRTNNLNAIRLLAATLVIASHSFALRFGTRGLDYEPLLVFTRGMLSMGGLAVGFFFLYGGFLIARSAEAHPAAKDYFKRRIARIFPELIAVVLLCAFVLGPILSRLSIADYFLSSQTYLYLFNALLIPVHNLPGVFENNVYQYVVNGSLWTLPVEFACYALVLFSLKITNFEYKRFSWLFLPFSVALAAYICAIYPTYATVMRPVFLYFIGMACYVYRDSIKISGVHAGIALLLFLVLCPAGLVDLAMLTCFPVIALWLAFYAPRPERMQILSKYDFSYGLYLWGWPIGQILVELLPSINVILLAVSTTLIGTLAALGTMRVVSFIQRTFGQSGR